MKRFLFLLVAVTLLGISTRVSAFFIREGDRVVFLGDSITEQKLYTTYIEAYVLTRYPKWELYFRNVGWGGDTAWLRQRAHPDEKQLFAAQGAELDAMVVKAVGAGLERDVLPLKPTVVTIDFGMNDHAYQAFRPDIFRAYVRSQAELATVLKKHGAHVALLTPQPIEQSVQKPDPSEKIKNDSLRKFSDGLKVVAAEKQVLFVDQFDPYMELIRKARAANPPTNIGGGDAVHPGPAGHTLMAWAILNGLGATPLVSSAEINARWNHVVSASGCRVTNVKTTNGALSFDRLDGALPMPIDPRAVSALSLAPVLADLNQYMLKVIGLKAEKYELSIDGEPVGSFTKDDLAKGVNLAMATGPITKQAQDVLQLIFKKNNAFFNRWRNLQLKNAPPAELIKCDQEVAELETKIDALRQPKLRHFELKP